MFRTILYVILSVLGGMQVYDLHGGLIAFAVGMAVLVGCCLVDTILVALINSGAF